MIEDILGPVVSISALIALWMFEGFALKYVDQVVDEGRTVRKMVLWSVLFVAGVAAGFFMVTDSFTSGATFALVLAMILSKKIDNKLWFYQIVIVFGSYIIILNLVIESALSWVVDFFETSLVFVIVLAGSILDEVSHGALEGKSRSMRWFGEWRFVMKILVVLMAIFIPFVQWYHALSWILFDMAYEITARRYAASIIKKPEPIIL
ncbi:MAG: hypothetical protein JW839_10815 [Candidatus Lokiarchaeota archaeon]|nr:hypothetical protein [Candidatus Lokiarchaeota archaeon]